MNLICSLCGIELKVGEPHVIMHGPRGSVEIERAHRECAEKQELRERAAVVGDVFDTWLTDGKPARVSWKVLVGSIIAVGPLHDVQIRGSAINGLAHLRVLSLPMFGVVGPAGKTIQCTRADSLSLVGPMTEHRGTWGTTTLHMEPQPAGSPTRVATEKSRDNLIIAWAEVIKANRAK
jgi:hypothetical protein